MFQYFKSIGIISRSDDHFEKYLIDFFRHFLVYGRIRDQDSSESRHRITGQSIFPCFHHVAARSDTAGIVMLQDGECQFVEFIDQIYSRVDVEQVVVRNLLSMQLVEHIVELAIELGSLMRVFTVAQMHRIVYGNTEIRALAIIEIIEDCGIVA